MSGRIVQCKVEEGEIITSGRTAWSQGPPIMTIADLSQMIVKVKVHELDISKIKVGQKAEIKVGSYKDEVFEGVVKEISPRAQFVDNVLKFEVTVIITKAPKQLLPGMTADVDIIVAEREGILQLPLQAIDIREKLKIKVDVAKEKLSKLKDQKVDIIVSNIPDKKFAGKVIEIAQEKQGTYTSEVAIIFDEATNELESGTTRTVDIITSGGEKIPSIEAKVEVDKRYYVRFVKGTSTKSESNKGLFSKILKRSSPEGEVETIEDEEREIKVGERTQSSIEIVNGLKEGDRVRVVPVGEEKGKKEKKG
jgi:multidrug efflux pump subunit AcrA (membrane-fusion protein)